LVCRKCYYRLGCVSRIWLSSTHPSHITWSNYNATSRSYCCVQKGFLENPPFSYSFSERSNLMTPSGFVSRRCMFQIASKCNHDRQLRYSNLFLPWCKFTAPRQKASSFCSSKKSPTKDSPKTTNLRRPKKDPSNDFKLNQSAGSGTTVESKLAPPQPPSVPILPTASPSVSKFLDILPMPDVRFTSVYVHPLSQIVLNHFQTHCHDWIRSKRLDHNLLLRQDGTFVLKSSGRPPNRVATSTASKKASFLLSKNFRFTLPYADKRLVEDRLTVGATAARSFIRIWTLYDTEENKHWLCVSMDESRFSTKYLLQDNSLTPWQGFKLQSVPERVCASVHQLMDAVNDYENDRKQ
jgi:hypothetical protein